MPNPCHKHAKVHANVCSGKQSINLINDRSRAQKETDFHIITDDWFRRSISLFVIVRWGLAQIWAQYLLFLDLRLAFFPFLLTFCFILFSLLFPSLKRFMGASSSFVLEKRCCQCWVFVCLFVFRLGYFIYFLCFQFECAEPPGRERSRSLVKEVNGLLFFSTPKYLFLDRAIGPSCFRQRHVFFSTSSFFSAPQ